ncbi:fimbria/pilus outer membrane usher protein [Sphingopyxis sp. L1A2A]|uniref:fimbria/pilus outer membrane usher protein n=1 Tax=Sphingopyxis sp. L1A2A TaxID=2502247 RepID=UPI0020160103|nr:fimbria/pilus outer membrane usher protein [Sphingopyxis sp. L1A2A]
MRLWLRGAGSAIAISVGLLSGHTAAASEIVEAALPAANFVQSASPDSPEALARRPDINPYNRDIEITAPLQFNRRVLGELPVLLTSDDRFVVGTEGFLSLIGPLLTPEAQAELRALLGDKPRFLPDDVSTSGIRLEYDPEQLAVLVLKIAPEKRSVEVLYQNRQAEEPGDPPLPFSAFLNLSTTVSRISQTGNIEKPELFLNGAVRYNNLVLEADAQARRDFFTDKYKFERRYARLVYDQPEQARRWFLGDLDPETRGRQGFINMGGIGVVRQRQRFDSFRNNVLSGGRRLVLQEQSVVRVLRNGIYQREFTLDPGQYDISNLPLDTGSNNVQIEVQGQSGARETFDYQAYLDTIDLEPGDYEYGAYVGILDDGGFGNPDYSSKTPVFTGFWRKAFLNRPAIGVGTQLTQDVQNITGQTQFLLANSGRIRLDVGGSHSKEGTGYAATVGYDQIIGGATGYDTLTVIVDYTSRRYATVGGIEGVNPISFNLSAAYTKRFSQKLFATTNASYRKSRSPLFDDAYSISTTANYRFNREWTAQFGAEYVKSGFPGGFGRNNGFGVTVGLVWQPRYNRRAEARYNSLRNNGSARYQQTVDNRAGSFGYSLATNYTDGATSVGGQVDYVGNRFDANLTHTVFGDSFDNIGDSQVTTLRLGSSIAFAGGKVAVGRTINDSFALVYPHKTLKDRQVIVGDALEGGNYVSKSGALGPAVQNSLTAFINQSVRYDVIDPPRGYDIGEGVKRVRPAYKSGYVIEVGSAAFVSAIGTLKGRDGQPLKLVSGIMRRTDVADGKEEPFFTNTAGRFAIAKLEPGAEYSVQFHSGGHGAFTFRVPEDNDGLLELGVVELGRKEGP